VFVLAYAAGPPNPANLTDVNNSIIFLTGVVLGLGVIWLLSKILGE